MALLFRRVVRHFTPGEPICFRSYKGIKLMPELLSALKWWERIFMSSSGVIWCMVAFVRGVYSSAGMFESKKIDSLNLMNSVVDSSISLFLFDFSMFQNCFGRCFSISGNSNYICALPSLQFYINCAMAAVVCA